MITAFRRFGLLLLSSLCALSLYAQDVTRAYIDRYAPLAVAEMYRSGVPASITLAQGILESASGRSRLAVEANNHFGIQCHRGWTGKRIQEKDNGEIRDFRVYESVADSYRDHSDFLRGNRRYAALFELDITDYKGWAKGLKKAGYAEAPEYASSLISLVERYELGRYDRMTLEDADRLLVEAEESASSQEEQLSDGSRKERRRHVSRRERKKRNAGEGYEKIEIPEAPSVLEAPKKVTEAVQGRFHFTLSRPVYTQGGVAFVYSVEGETYSSIARSFNLFDREILRFNDLREDRPLAPGTVVYIEAKHKQAVKGLDAHVAEAGETLRDIAQDFAVKEKSLRKINGFAADFEPAEGDLVYLRKPVAGRDHWWQFWK